MTVPSACMVKTIPLPAEMLSADCSADEEKVVIGDGEYPVPWLVTDNDVIVAFRTDAAVAVMTLHHLPSISGGHGSYPMPPVVEDVDFSDFAQSPIAWPCSSRFPWSSNPQVQ